MFGWRKPRRPEVVAIDVIGTLFPLEPLRYRIMEMGLPASGLESWFAIALRDAFALAATGDFAPFTTVLEQALDQILAEHKLDPERRLRTGLVTAMETLPARPQSRAAFEALARADIRIVAVTNGAKRTTRKLLGASGLESLVERIVSVEEVKLFKPRQEVYRRVARVCGTKPKRIALVAIHPWDVHGAKSAGMSTAFIAGDVPFPSIMGKPDIEGSTLDEVVAAFLALRPPLPLLKRLRHPLAAMQPSRRRVSAELRAGMPKLGG